ncbi:MAG: carboxypeptidase-like regulatory domain-containing protein [Chitinophagaceae bacterium]|nr:carboxypeptidase-like regulatory domain-containing protein [Chitinophagaceae bacterium]MCA6475252.1 carboxypeptidase-like regulatory domain-containing protein [Chitinophagaceae bacterium]MCA6492223.1 carboxypeptidase-like regulatory domain-containing protein [Chitinophagaceae bacterium]MCA6497420.1 carboxypeptidase-like regulatory domain-containing protein [Chitinophagaceae bacterium]MCA6512283.1 carboxypeptidase-like regulatory domain-containing protein [Chitinophagaceae bacterium]
MRSSCLFLLVLFAASILSGSVLAQQVTISGTVYDLSARRPLEAVGVISTSGKGTITDSMGRYSITVPAQDSIWFSLIGKTTMKYPVDTISNTENFNVMLHLRAFDLPDVVVRNSYYRFDSIKNRRDNAKAFDFRKPTLRLTNNPNFNPGGLTAGFDINEIINMFRFKRTASLLNLQRRLLIQEQDKYIDSRFTKPFVRKITRLTSPDLDSFMVRYRPDYETLLRLNDLELGYMIGKNYELFRSERFNWRGGLRRRR